MSNLRKSRIFGISVFDLVVSLIGMIVAFLIMWKWHFSKLNPLNFVIAAILLIIPFGIVIHVLFGSNTTLNSRLGLSYKPI